MSGAADGELQRKIEEYRARERVYLAGLMGQEADLSRLKAMASDVSEAYGDRSRAASRGALVYPTANMEVLILRQKLRDRDQQITLLKEELEANRFDQKLPAGQALMRKCKALLTENRELGDEMREERMGELHAALQTEQSQNAELYKKLDEASEFCTELSDENMKLQSTIAKVAGKLRESRAELEVLTKERTEAKKKRKIEKEAKAVAAALKASVGAVEGQVAPVVAESAEDPPNVFAPVQRPPPATATEDVAAATEEIAEHKVKEKKKDKKDKKKRKADKAFADDAEG